MTHSEGSDFALGDRLLCWGMRRFCNDAQSPVKRLWAFVGTNFARFVDELLALGFAFVIGFLLRHEIAFPFWREPS